MKRRPYVLKHKPCAEALALPGEALALDPNAFGKAFLPVEDPADAAATAVVPGLVAVVPICGPLFHRAFSSPWGCIDGYDSILARFEAALKHPQVGAVVLVIDSPGGETAGLYETVRRMTEARDRAGKKVFAYADECVASAAYALATVADGGIFLPRSGEVGSIGVLIIHTDATAANEKDGYRVTIVRSGPRKFEGSQLEPLTDVALAAIQNRVDGLALEFFELVAASRGMTPDQVAALGGAMFSGQQAVDAGLANGVATLEQVVTRAGEAVSGAPMTDEEKAEMEALKAENAKLKAELAEDEESSDEEAEETEEETSDGDEEDDSEEEKPAKATKATKAENAKLKAEIARRDLKEKARDLVDAAAIAGKVKPGKKKELVELGVAAGLSALKIVIAALPDAAPARKKQEGGPPPSIGAAALTAEDKLIAKQMGVSEEAFAQSKASLAEKGMA